MAQNKSEMTRERIRQAAFELFASQGFEETTMRHIAERAECSIGLTYRYFGGKDELVSSLYRELFDSFEGELAKAPPGSFAERFEWAVRQKVQLLAPIRTTLATAMGSALRPDTPVSILGAESSDIRQRHCAAFQKLIEESTDAATVENAENLAVLLYVAYMSIMLFWFYDPTEGGKSTNDLSQFMAQLLKLTPLLQTLAGPQLGVDRLADILRPVFLAPVPGEN
ncbi:MAG: TetR/AcrR family transcriptional regulator [Proteobacteria bacterium]|jgi:AcrR family transcriptional regulator|nr:TetR/AcrR family transcriptional regulator [Pseudomonadota bacterium]